MAPLLFLTAFRSQLECHFTGYSRLGEAPSEGLIIPADGVALAGKGSRTGAGPGSGASDGGPGGGTTITPGIGLGDATGSGPGMGGSTGGPGTSSGTEPFPEGNGATGTRISANLVDSEDAACGVAGNTCS